MDSKIVTIERKFIVGYKKEMSLVDHQTGILWKNFIPKLSQILNRVDSLLISATVYPSDYFENFHPSHHFIKWAGVEVSDIKTIPDGLEVLEIPTGLYSCFEYKGHPNDAGPFYQTIFQDWFPKSGYELDNRPHFEEMGEKYKNDDPNSEELVYIPILKR
ncbi:GyrI-like domain-containing protein [Leptospira brenneri]|uniref:AraC family transcriptional regulator n=1 Tax=Leptospira brenneri TaxID=2023182 RepID=A0A2M9Y5G7_9LEPT|nr:GyrI-like domain-containing protein [Leptospira brenneri]PJZ46801.1 GyrI-like domain-containing protein [Leptospira brenneri]TGK96244.1 AraC family transcriptional regulator [Leptospira brenneri]